MIKNDKVVDHFFEAAALCFGENPVPLSAQMQLLNFKSCAAKLHNRCNRGYTKGFASSSASFYERDAQQ